jgi:hypothetical protein
LNHRDHRGHRGKIGKLCVLRALCGEFLSGATKSAKVVSNIRLSRSKNIDAKGRRYKGLKKKA